MSSIDARQRCYCFLTALFLEAAKIVERFHDSAPEGRALAFHDYLSEEMTFGKHGPNRVKYYQDVHECAKTVKLICALWEDLLTPVTIATSKYILFCET